MKEFYSINTSIIPLSLIDENEGQIDGVPANPRFITDEKFEDLKKSITDDTEYMNYHPLEVYPLNGRYISLGGNMRTKALRDLGFDSAPCVVFKVDTPVEILKGRILKGNYGYGEWDKTMLAEDWDMAELEAWGMEDITDAFIEDVQGQAGENKELDMDEAEDKVTMKLQFTIEENAFVNQQLSESGRSKEQVLLNLLGYEE